MKIALVCSHGGHLTEMQFLMDAFKEKNLFFITYKSPRTEKLPYSKYLIDNIGTSYLKMLRAFAKTFCILVKEKPDVIVSTGSEIAIPAFYIAKLLGIKTIYVESWCRINTPSRTGKIVYPISDVFLVQWPQLLNKYGKKAQFRGAII